MYLILSEMKHYLVLKIVHDLCAKIMKCFLIISFDICYVFCSSSVSRCWEVSSAKPQKCSQGTPGSCEVGKVECCWGVQISKMLNFKASQHMNVRSKYQLQKNVWSISCWVNHGVFERKDQVKDTIIWRLLIRELEK